MPLLSPVMAGSPDLFEAETGSANSLGEQPRSDLHRVQAGLGLLRPAALRGAMTKLHPREHTRSSPAPTSLRAISLCAAVCFSCATPQDSESLSAGDLVDTQGGSSSASANTTSPTVTGEASSTTSGTSGKTSVVTSGGTLLHDVGFEEDLGSSTPAGCGGKIDFLFVLSRHYLMHEVQDKLVKAFPAFINTIESEFADFDYHIMVVDGDERWGSESCNELCTPEGCEQIDDYPCSYVDKITPCDTTLGAGSVFPAGRYATNAPCPMSGSNRYLSSGEAGLNNAFACVARIGASGDDRVAEALVAAIDSSAVGQGGCNEGFLREDALLVVTVISGYDYDSAGTPEGWASAVVSAKAGDPNAVVMLSITDPACPPYDRVCQLAKTFPHHVVGHVLEDDYGSLFEETSLLVSSACEDLVPQ